MVANFNKKWNREFFNDKLLFKTVGIIFLVLIFVLIVADIKMYNKKRELASQINTFQKQIEDIKKSSQTLKDEIVNADNIDYLEKLGYEQLDQTRPGETEYMFVRSQKNPEAVSKPESFWDIKLWPAWLSNGFNWIKSKF